MPKCGDLQFVLFIFHWFRTFRPRRSFPAFACGSNHDRRYYATHPGLAMTNSIRDVLVGDTISGVMRLTESLLWAGALACGFMASIWLIGG